MSVAVVPEASNLYTPSSTVDLELLGFQFCKLLISITTLVVSDFEALALTGTQGNGMVPATAFAYTTLNVILSLSAPADCAAEAASVIAGSSGLRLAGPEQDENAVGIKIVESSISLFDFIVIVGR